MFNLSFPSFHVAACICFAFEWYLGKETQEEGWMILVSILPLAACLALRLLSKLAL